MQLNPPHSSHGRRLRSRSARALQRTKNIFAARQRYALQHLCPDQSFQSFIQYAQPIQQRVTLQPPIANAQQTIGGIGMELEVAHNFLDHHGHPVTAVITHICAPPGFCDDWYSAQCVPTQAPTQATDLLNYYFCLVFAPGYGCRSSWASQGADPRRCWCLACGRDAPGAGIKTTHPGT